MKSAVLKRPARVLFHVQHLLGIGHVFRARRLAEGLSEAGMRVEIVFGGMPLSGMCFAADKLHRLPPIRAGAEDYSVMLDCDDRPLGPEYQDVRAKRLRAIFEGSGADLVLVEQYPFGRRMLMPEMRALLDAVERRTPRPLVVCSVRDILQERRKPGRAEEAVALVRRHFDFVLVHSDPGLIRLDESFPLAPRIAEKLRYTGIVTAGGTAVRPPTEAFDVIVTAGGGAFGAGLLRAARAAMEKTPPDLRWVIVTGPNLPADVVEELNSNAPPNLAVREFLQDLRTHLQASRLSVSQAGYNTVADVLAAGCRAVLVPYDVAGQTEQLRRAELLQRCGRVTSLPQSAATPERLAAAVTTALTRPLPDTRVDLNGVANSVAIIGKVLEAARSRR